MIFHKTPLEGAFVIEWEPRVDERGFFARTFCEREFETLGLVSRFVQCNIAHNNKRGTLRGMHWRGGASEAKVVRAIQGSIWDVIVDLNENSSSYLQSFGVELSQRNGLALYVPPMFAHGFQTLVDDSEVLYLMSEFYDPQLDRGMRWNDPKLRIEWPVELKIMNDRDRSYVDFS